MFGRGAERFVDIVQVLFSPHLSRLASLQFWSLCGIRHYHRRRASPCFKPLFPEQSLVHLLLFDQPRIHSHLRHGLHHPPDLSPEEDHCSPLHVLPRDRRHHLPHLRHGRPGHHHPSLRPRRKSPLHLPRRHLRHRSQHQRSHLLQPQRLREKLPSGRVGPDQIEPPRVHYLAKHLPRPARVLLRPLLASAVHPHSQRHAAAHQKASDARHLHRVYRHFRGVQHQLARWLYVVLRICGKVCVPLCELGG
ncbi:uncharacterized protein [Blastocystis hominis]|uniref:Uncharacterized protein n=1 Tax=Blastocystis hominis TaxID=12968 RepID=D8M908_BLAHO|nr:uncharacterized protein [Blastocystis hominis]CBK24547.2 unnamed protein product [Blastocystis hominis]|eukprot:XP_012898595.1 uncharacterized protein [Blastocystis hominis]